LTLSQFDLVDAVNPAADCGLAPAEQRSLSYGRHIGSSSTKSFAALTGSISTLHLGVDKDGPKNLREQLPPMVAISPFGNPPKIAATRRMRFPQREEKPNLDP